MGVSKEVTRERTYTPSATGANACVPDAPAPGCCGRKSGRLSWRGPEYQRPCHEATHGYYRARDIASVPPWPEWPGVDDTPVLPGKIALVSGLLGILEILYTSLAAL